MEQGYNEAHSLLSTLANNEYPLAPMYPIVPLNSQASQPSHVIQFLIEDLLRKHFISRSDISHRLLQMESDMA
jgi:hypothetical protein